MGTVLLIDVIVVTDTAVPSVPAIGPIDTVAFVRGYGADVDVGAALGSDIIIVTDTDPAVPEVPDIEDIDVALDNGNGGMAVPDGTGRDVTADGHVVVQFLVVGGLTAEPVEIE